MKSFCCTNVIISRTLSIVYFPLSSSSTYLSICCCKEINTPPIIFLNKTVESLILSGTTLSIFLIKITSASISFRFSIRAPCPPGRNTNLPLSLKGSFCISAAIVSVDGFCSEKLTEYFTLNFFS